MTDHVNRDHILAKYGRLDWEKTDFAPEVKNFPDRFPDNRFERSEPESIGHQLDRKLSDHLSAVALRNGWSVRRMTATYFRATREGAGVVTEFGASVLHGHLKVSRVEVRGETADVDEALRWLEADR